MKKYFNKILRIFNLAFAEDYKYADSMWILTLNHIERYLLDSHTDLNIKKNLIKLLVNIDENGDELINDFLIDWKKDNIKKDYKKVLNVICPIIIKEQKRLQREGN